MYGLICLPIAKLMKDPHKMSELLDEVLYGTPIEVLNEQNHFYLIKTFYHYIGYVNKDDVYVLKKIPNHLKEYNGILTKHFVDILIMPSDKSNPILSLPRGSYVKILPEKLINGYQAIELINEKRGYIKDDCFKYRKTPDLAQNEMILRENLVKNALTYLGSQYRWGGKTILGMDCSGLCHMSYLLEDLFIYRDTNLNDDLMQFYHLKQISIEEIKAGDLIYMPNHMMMYIGNNQYINSSSKTSGVTIHSLLKNDPLYLSYHVEHITFCASIFNKEA